MSLRDLINKSKQEKANAVISSQTVQSQAVPQKAAQETKFKPATNLVMQAHETKAALANLPIANTVVEQGPPKGLTGLALIRWKKEHGNKIPNIPQGPVSTGVEKVSASPGELPKPSEEKSQGVGAQTGASSSTPQSASGLADSQKTNSGTADISALRANLTFLSNNIGQKEIVAQVVRTIAIQLQNSPELVKGMSNADVDTVVRGLRSAYNIAARKKSENKEARQKKGADTSALHAAFNDAGLGELTSKLTKDGKITF